MAIPSVRALAPGSCCAVLSIAVLFNILTTVVASGGGGSSNRQDPSQLEVVEFVSRHNAARAQVGEHLPSMNWNLTLYQFALSWAQNQAWNRNCKLEHSDGPFGENIFWASWKSSPSQAVDDWVSEREFYDYASNSCSASDHVCGHYTQVVWRDSIHVGCASVFCLGTSATFTVCSYDPPGNWIDQPPY